MATDTFNFYQDFAEQIGKEIHQLDSDTIKAALTSTAPTATHATYSQIQGELGTANGYTATGADCQVSFAESAGLATATGVNVIWTATGGNFGGFQYVVFYNDSATSKNLIGWVDYGSLVTVTTGETFTLDIDGGIFVVNAT